MNHMKKKKDFKIYIPEEGHWPILGQYLTTEEAKKAWLSQVGRKRLPAGSFIQEGKF